MTNWKEKARNELNAIVGNLAYKDYKQANTGTRYTKTGRPRKHKPYSLSLKTIQAKEILSLTYKEETTKEEEEQIKAYLLPFRLGTRKLP